MKPTTSEVSNHQATLILMLRKKKKISIISTASYIAISILTLLLPPRTCSKDQMAKETISNPNHQVWLGFIHLVNIILVILFYANGRIY